MQPSDRTALAAILATAAIPTGRQVTDDMVSLYLSVLDDMTLAEVGAAVKAHLRSPDGRFFPTPAHILAARQGDSQAEATRALAILQGAIRDVGSYRQPEFTDPLIQRAVIAMGGWREVCQMPSEMLLPHFRKAYEGMHRGGQRQELEATGGFLPRGTGADPLCIGDVVKILPLDLLWPGLGEDKRREERRKGE